MAKITKNVNQDIVVYVAESGEKYTYQDVLNLAKGNEMYAKLLIERLTWQHVETMIEEDLINEEIFEIDGHYVINYWLDEEELDSIRA